MKEKCQCSNTLKLSCIDPAWTFCLCLNCGNSIIIPTEYVEVLESANQGTPSK